ncbi:uncharacterized protein VTP21DRAFT_2427 [Calcarisporiella thermophila]|uniref:uncharacterized protein n=1 Tax=Calcarisporiella thermophila TaxID=911321 RepID=UPI003744B182
MNRIPFLNTTTNPPSASCLKSGFSPKLPTPPSVKTIAVHATDREGQPCELVYSHSNKIVGNGSFGMVYYAKILNTSEDVAIKKVLQDKRFKNRELQIMKVLDHPNIVQLKSYFYTNGEKNGEVYLQLVLDYVPQTIYRVTRDYAKQKQPIPMLLVKLYMYQVFRSLAYIHALGICHRDIKPQNLLLDPASGIVRLCDFGSAKILLPSEPNVSYICSRYYRAPELIFGATNYTTSIDIWSAACVMAEMMLGQPLFPGESGIDQLVEIIKVLGTPTREQIRTMNPNYMEQRFPQIKPHPLTKVFPISSPSAPEAIDLLSRLLVYVPTQRLSALEAMCHPFFDELRDPATRMHGSRLPLPPLFDFSELELSIRPDLVDRLVPPHAEPLLRARGIDVHGDWRPIPLEQLRRMVCTESI